MTAPLFPELVDSLKRQLATLAQTASDNFRAAVDAQERAETAERQLADLTNIAYATAEELREQLAEERAAQEAVEPKEISVHASVTALLEEAHLATAQARAGIYDDIPAAATERKLGIIEGLEIAAKICSKMADELQPYSERNYNAEDSIARGCAESIRAEIEKRNA